MTVDCDQAVVLGFDQPKSVTLVAGGIETDYGTDVSLTANKALWEPTFIPLMAHGRE
jgi:hypothetical protein